MRYAVHLRARRSIEGRVTVTMKVHPYRRGTVQISPASRVEQIRTLSAFDDQRFFLLPLLHLREGMPEISAVPFGQQFGTDSFRHLVRTCARSVRKKHAQS